MRSAVLQYGHNAFRLHIFEEVPFDEAGLHERIWYDKIAKDHYMYNHVAPAWKSISPKHAKKASFLKRLYDDEKEKAWGEIYETLVNNNIVNGKKEQAKYTPTEVCNLLQKAFAL